ncbi:MAG: hypothetical protein V4683_15545 [Bacteroidota bacterium]
MKKINILFLILSLSSSQIYAQSGIIVIPDGLIVGSSTLTIPATGPYKLAVSGGILTEKVRVATIGTAFWADFVFDKSYKLKTLNEVEKYILKNKHLPDIPSSKEVNEKGIDLAETQALLLQKIEELTLYMIKQNKEIGKLKTKIRKLENKNVTK